MRLLRGPTVDPAGRIAQALTQGFVRRAAVDGVESVPDPRSWGDHVRESVATIPVGRYCGCEEYSDAVALLAGGRIPNT